MDTLQKLALSAEASCFESDGHTKHTSEAKSAFGRTQTQLRQRFGQPSTLSFNADGHDIPIHLSPVSGGRVVPLLKAMLTTACERNCFYCPFQTGRNYQRITFRPEELALIYMKAFTQGYVDGLFLSTGVFSGGSHTQDKLIETAAMLRTKLGYRGYLHLKIMPGAEFDQVYQAMQYADRVSTNLEAPNPSRLCSLAPQKDFDDELLQPLLWVEQIRNSKSSHLGWNGRWPSTTTQFVVGPAGESDLELLSTVAGLNKATGLRRAYFEAFNPIPDTPLEDHPEEDERRQLRLYQASYLLRDYGFEVEDFCFSANGRLMLDKDPKVNIADQLYAQSPVEVNKAPRATLLRIPGIGPRSASAIVKARNNSSISELNQLSKLGILTERVAPYITLQGQRPHHQLRLF